MLEINLNFYHLTFKLNNSKCNFEFSDFNSNWNDDNVLIVT